MEEKYQKRKGSRMSDDKALIFFSVWREYVPGLRSARKNLHVLIEMQYKLKEAGLELRFDEIRNRIHNFTKKYRLEKQKVGVSGGSPSDWKYFVVLDQFLGSYMNNFCSELGEDSVDSHAEQPSHNQEYIEEMYLDVGDSQSSLELDACECVIDEVFEGPLENSDRRLSLHSPTPSRVQSTQSTLPPRGSGDNSNSNSPVPGTAGTSTRKRKRNLSESNNEILLGISQEISEIVAVERERNEILARMAAHQQQMVKNQSELLELIRIAMSRRSN